MAMLIDLMGGPEIFESHLDTMFIPQLSSSTAEGNSAGRSMIFNPGNEPSFMTPFLYNYVKGRQWKSIVRARHSVDEFYSNGRSGLPGNDDAGTLSRVDLDDDGVVSCHDTAGLFVVESVV